MAPIPRQQPLRESAGDRAAPAAAASASSGSCASCAVGFAGISYNSRRTSVKIYTRTGDAGETSLFDGTRVSKADPRVDAYGEVDELNAWLGLVARRVDARSATSTTRSCRSSAICSRSAPGSPIRPTRSPRASPRRSLGDADVARLEQLIDRLEAELPPLRALHPGRRRAGRRRAARGARPSAAAPSGGWSRSTRPSTRSWCATSTGCPICCS